MKPGLDPGKSFELQVVVTRAMCPHFDGVLHHPVCATWTLVEHMEVAGRKLLQPHLDDDEEGVGAHISVDHRAPAPIGATVRVRAEVISCTHRRLTTLMTAWCGGRVIAEGRFVQVILPKAKLAALFRENGVDPHP